MPLNTEQRKIDGPAVAVVFAFLMIASIAAAAPPGSGSTKMIVEKIQAHYGTLDDYQASFVQTTAHKLFAGRLQRAYGKVTFKKGGLMRWTYTKPEHKLFLYDGKTLWVYEPEVPQAFRGEADAARLSKALAFLTGQGRILDSYRAKMLSSEKFGFKEGVVVGLWPREKHSPFKRVELYVAQDTFQVVRSVVVDQEGNRNRIDFIDPQVNQGLSQNLFTFTPPPGVPVIEP